MNKYKVKSQDELSATDGYNFCTSAQLCPLLAEEAPASSSETALLMSYNLLGHETK